MTLSDLNPHIRYARIHQNSLGRKDKISVCYDCRIFFFRNIVGKIIINGVPYEIHNHTAIYLPPKTQYQFHVLFQENAQAFIFDFDLTSEYSYLLTSLGTATLETFDSKAVPAYSLPQELSLPIIAYLPHLAHMLQRCTDYFLHRDPYFRESSSALLKLCLLEIVGQKTNLAQSRICKDVLTYIHRHYNDPSLTNKTIAERFHYHPDHLSALIRQETKKSLHQYLIFYRLQIAKNYLLTTQYDISEVSWRSGFASAAYFIKTFRKNTGLTPAAYRRQRIHTEI